MDQPRHRGHQGEVPGLGDGALDTQCLEWCPICRTMDVLRASTTPEVREQWQQVQREAVLTLRALVDHYAHRLAEDGQPTTDSGRSTSEPRTTGDPANEDGSNASPQSTTNPAKADAKRSTAPPHDTTDPARADAGAAPPQSTTNPAKADAKRSISRE